MAKKRMKITPPCRCGERRIKTQDVTEVKVFGIVFRKPETQQRCIACKTIRRREFKV